MTIKVEREALVTVLSQAPLLHASRCEGPSISSSGDYVLVDFNSKSPCLNADVVLCSTYSDEDSLCTLSTSSDSLSSDASIDKRVTFSSSLVTDEWTRPFTPRDEVAKLFYSTEDTNRFRQEYRIERKVLNELSIDPDTFPADSEELSNLVLTCPEGNSPLGRHSISRVVVLHNNKLETFFNPDEAFQEKEPVSGDFFDNDSFWSGSLTWY